MHQFCEIMIRPVPNRGGLSLLSCQVIISENITRNNLPSCHIVKIQDQALFKLRIFGIFVHTYICEHADVHICTYYVYVQ